jgi:two-component system LytT family sensor kinase
MKNFIILLITCLLGLSASAQMDKNHSSSDFGNYIYFDALADQHNVLYKNNIHGIYVPDDAVFRIFSKDVSEHKLASPIALGVKLDPKQMFYGMMPVQSFNKSFPAFHIKGKSPAVVIAMGINKGNINDYRYRVVLNDSVEVVHWSAIPGLDQQYGAKQPYGFIGNFSFPGMQVLVEVVNVKDYNIRSGVVFDWRSDLRPFPFGVIASGSKNNPHVSPDFDAKRDSVTQRITQITCVQGTVGTINVHLRQHPGVGYGSSIDRFGTDGQPIYRGFGLDEDNSGEIKFDVDTLPAGNYTISIFPFSGSTNGIMAGGDQVTSIDLIITAPKSTSVLDKKTSLKQLIPYLIGAALLVALLFWLYRRRANLRLARSTQARQNVNLKMRSIRAQLNPHFMFNALTSIQNLVNKKDMEGANHYLSRFASLTRKVLNTGEKELISLEEELKILDDYLQMEQLRFGFQYRIETEANVNMANTEVPAMLLQPFVENAVKHGVSDLRERGEIAVVMRKENNTLKLIITDNGIGFKQKTDGQSGSSFGLKLSQERIELLNQLYSGNPFSLKIDSNADGTTVTVTLTDWIS